MPTNSCVEYWCVGGAARQYLPLTLADVSGHLAADWVPSLPAAVGTSFVGWPPFLLEANPSRNRELIGLRSIAGRSERQWKGVLSWMLGIAGTREVSGPGHNLRSRPRLHGRPEVLLVKGRQLALESAALTECQKDARAGRFAEAMGAYVRWLAGRYDAARKRFEQLITEYRGDALRNLAHARTPDIVANLQAGLALFLDFCVESSAIDSAKRDRLLERCWTALCQAAAAQTKHQMATEPATRFIALIGSLLSSGRARLEARDGGKPTFSPTSCGWRSDGSGGWEPLGECIGWVDRDDLYLDLTAAFRVTQLAGRDIGELIAISELTLKKRLHEKGLLASIDRSHETLTVRRSIGGTTKYVLHFLRSTILPEVSDADEDAARMSGCMSGCISGF